MSSIESGGVFCIDALHLGASIAIQMIAAASKKPR